MKVRRDGHFDYRVDSLVKRHKKMAGQIEKGGRGYLSEREKAHIFVWKGGREEIATKMFSPIQISLVLNKKPPPIPVIAHNGLLTLI